MKNLRKNQNSSEFEIDSDQSFDLDTYKKSKGNISENINNFTIQQYNGPTTELTTRLAITGLNWSNTSAKQILKALNSILQDKTEIKKVQIYKTIFGKQELEEMTIDDLKKSYFCLVEVNTKDTALYLINTC